MDKYLNLTDNMFSGVSEMCLFHSRMTIQSLIMGSMWALKMFDSSTKVPTSVLTGNLFDFGNYDECLEVTVEEVWGSFVGQHCITEIPIPLKMDSGANITKVPYRWSLCLPSTCSPQDLEQMLEAVIPLNVTVNPFMCHNRKRLLSFRNIDWIAIFILTILALTCIFGTMIDILNKNITEKYKWLIQFSWYKNGKTLLTTNLHADSIPILHGIRFFSIAWVVLGHVCQFSTILPQINYLDVMDNVRTWRYLIFTNAVLAVDTCFLLSGILLSYIFIKSTENGQQFNLPVFYLHRLLRILPVLGLIILLQLSLISRLGSGPLWDIVMVDGQQKNCEQYWWATLLFIQNYVNIKDMCVPAAWYLSVDMQMYWFSPIFLLALRRKPKFGIGLLVAAAILGIVLAFQQSYYHLDLASSISTMGNSSDRYYQTHMRFVPWVIGLASGYLLYRTTDWRNRVANGKEHIPKKIVALAWTFSFIICIGVIHWLYPFEQKDYEYNAVQSSLYLAVARPLWAIGVFLIIFLCHCGYGGFITSILEWKALVPLSRLTFCIYLIHPEVLLSLMATTKLPGYMTGLSVIHSYFGYMVIVIMLSVVLTLTVEAPIIGLEKILLKRATKPSQFKNSIETGNEPAKKQILSSIKEL